MSYRDFEEMVTSENGRPSELTQKILSKFWKKHHKKSKCSFIMDAAILCSSLKACGVW